jgi:hypothetical protein
MLSKTRGGLELAKTSAVTLICPFDLDQAKQARETGKSSSLSDIMNYVNKKLFC